MSSKILSLVKFSLLLGLASSFSACSPADGSRKITIDAGFQVRSPSRAPYDMSERLTHMLTVAPPNTCLQNQIYLVVHDRTTDQVFSTQPIALFSNLPLTPAPTPTQTPVYTNSSADIDKAVDWIHNYSHIDSPIEVTVPNDGHAYDVGIMGEFFSPQDNSTHNINTNTDSSGPDGICDQVTTYNSNVATGSSAIFGKAQVAVNQAGVLPLNIETVHTNPSGGTFTLTANPGYFDQYDKDFNDGNAGPVYRLKSVSYLNGLINVRTDNGAWTYYFPSIYPGPYRLIFQDVTNNITYASTAVGRTICGGCSLIPNPVLVSGTTTFINGVISSINPGGITGALTISGATLNITAAGGGICTGTVTVITGNDTNYPQATQPISFHIADSNGRYSGNVTASISIVGGGAVSISGVGNYTGSCPTVLPFGGYGIIPQ